MPTFTNRTATKKVNITYKEFNGFRASYIQIINEGYQVREQVLEVKSFSTQKKATDWTKKQLGI